MTIHSKGQSAKSLQQVTLEDERIESAQNEPERVLAKIWAEVLGTSQIGLHDNFFELGGDSLLGFVVVNKARQAGYQITPKQVLQYQTIEELAAVVNTSPAFQTDPRAGWDGASSIPLSPSQHWYFEEDFAHDLNYWNSAGMLELDPPLEPELWKQALAALLEYHPSLRARFVRADSSWQQRIADLDEALPFAFIDLSTLSEEEQRSTIEATAAAMQRSLNISTGPVLRLTLFDLGTDRPGRLLLIMHHLVVDGPSIGIVIDDLHAAYQQVRHGQAVHLIQTTPFVQWHNRLRDYAQSTALRQELNYWLALPWERVAPLPRDYPQGTLIESGFTKLQVLLSPELSRSLLHDLPKRGVPFIEAFLTAMAHAFKQWTGNPTLLIQVMSHGREGIFEDVDLSRTVGWFTSLTPLLLDLGGTNGLADEAGAVIEQFHSVPNQGIGYGALRYLSDDRHVREQLRALPKPELLFNYLGHVYQGLSEDFSLRPARESTGPRTSERLVRLFVMDWYAWVGPDGVSFKIEYSENIHRRRTIERLAEQIQAALQELASS